MAPGEDSIFVLLSSKLACNMDKWNDRGNSEAEACTLCSEIQVLKALIYRSYRTRQRGSAGMWCIGAFPSWMADGQALGCAFPCSHSLQCMVPQQCPPHCPALSTLPWVSTQLLSPSPQFLLLLPAWSSNPLPPSLPVVMYSHSPTWGTPCNKSLFLVQVSLHGPKQHPQPPGRGWVKQGRNIPLHWSAMAPWNHWSPGWPSTWGWQLAAVTSGCGGQTGCPGPGELLSPLTAVEMGF